MALNDEPYGFFIMQHPDYLVTFNKMDNEQIKIPRYNVQIVNYIISGEAAYVSG